MEIKKAFNNKQIIEYMAHILIIDDDPQMLNMLGQILKREGYEVVEALDGKEGLKLYRENPADLVITDIIMPGTEGIETIMELQRDFPDVKIIAMSGGGHSYPEEYLYIARMLGVQKTFSKPIERDELLKVVNELLK
jgi:DNA-binding response OmpR family regulator